jgi:tripartite-type tricarboxylate transporter receptor subunit TctC
MKKAFLTAMMMLSLAGVSHAAAAQEYPTDIVRLSVPYAPGGTTDVLARLIAQELSAKYGKQVIVENKVGAGGNIAAAALAKAKPDGHNLMMASVGQFAINPLIFAKPGYDAKRDFIPVVAVAEVPNLLVSNPTSGIKSVKDLIAKSKASPGAINFASTGNGASTHLSGVLFARMAGVDMQHVPYKGSAPGLAALFSNEIHVMFDNLSSALSHVKSGKLTALAVTSRARFSQLPEVPTVAESGLKGYESTAWFGIVAPVGTPQAIVDKLNADINAVMKDQSMRNKFINMGVTPLGGSTAAFNQLINDDMPKWAPVVRDAKLEVN